MRILSRTIAIIDGITEAIGRIAAWFSVLMVLVTCYIVVSRYVFNSGSIAVQESLIYMNTVLVLVTAGFTLLHNDHVRVDIFYSRFGPRYKAWVNLIGTLLLLFPVAAFLFIACWDYVMSSWAIRESSREAGGLPFVYLLKTLLPVMCALIMLQGLAELLRNVRFLFFETVPPPHPDQEDLVL